VTWAFLRPALTALSAIGFLPVPLFEARAEFYTQPFDSRWTEPKAYSFLLGAGHYSTTANFDASGVASRISGLSGYQRIIGGLSADIGLSKKLSLYGNLRWVYASYQLTTSSNAPSIFGLGDQTAGLTFRAYQDSMLAIDLQAQGDFALYSNTSAKAGALPFLGDASTDLTAGAFLTLQLAEPTLRTWFLRGGGGYTFRTSQFSAAIPWSATIGTETQTAGFRAQVGAHGVLSLKSDPNAATAGSIRVDSTAAGGSFFINAVNPSILALRGAVGYQLTPSFGLEAFASSALWGQAAPQGFLIGGGLRFASTPLSRGKNYNHSNRGVVTYISQANDSEAKVIKTNEALRQVRINKGLGDGVEKRQIWDLFLTRRDGSPAEAVARAQVIQVDSQSSVLQIIEYFREVWIEEGFVARRPVD
jgi:hypothetical protein